MLRTGSHVKGSTDRPHHPFRSEIFECATRCSWAPGSSTNRPDRSGPSTRAGKAAASFSVTARPQRLRLPDDRRGRGGLFGIRLRRSGSRRSISPTRSRARMQCLGGSADKFRAGAGRRRRSGSSGCERPDIRGRQREIPKCKALWVAKIFGKRVQCRAEDLDTLRVDRESLANGLEHGLFARPQPDMVDIAPAGCALTLGQRRHKRPLYGRGVLDIDANGPIRDSDHGEPSGMRDREVDAWAGILHCRFPMPPVTAIGAGSVKAQGGWRPVQSLAEDEPSQHPCGEIAIPVCPAPDPSTTVAVAVVQERRKRLRHLVDADIPDVLWPATCISR